MAADPTATRCLIQRPMLDEFLVKTLGQDFIGYILACRPEELDSIELTRPRVDTLELLSQVAAKMAETDRFQRRYQLEPLFSYQPHLQTTLAEELSRQCGATPTHAAAADDLEVALLTLARDYRAASLLPPDPEDPRSSYLPLAVFHHPANQQLQLAALKDSSMRSLFPGAKAADWYESNRKEMHEVHSDLTWSSGNGGTFSLNMLAQNLLRAVFDMTSVRRPHSADDFLAGARTVLDVSRRLATKKTVDVSVLTGIGNLTLDAGLPHVPLAGGRLMPNSQALTSLLMGADGVTAALQTTVGLRLLHVEPWAPGPGDTAADAEESKRWAQQLPIFEAFGRELQRRIDLERFSVLLASEPGAVLAPVINSTTVLNPLATGRSSSRSPYRYPVAPFPAQAVSNSISSRISEWSTRLQSHPVSLDLRMRRLLGAVSSRLDPMDGFVDSIIAWENLVGTAEGESTFRIGGAMSMLIEPVDVEGRRKLLRELQDLYKVRSGLVHGASEPSYRSAVDTVIVL